MGSVYFLLCLAVTSVWGQENISTPSPTTLPTTAAATVRATTTTTAATTTAATTTTNPPTTTTPTPPPVDVTLVTVTEHTETSVTLQWDKQSPDYTYILQFSNGTEVNITELGSGSTVTKTVSSLTPGTKHLFTLFTVNEGGRSKGYNFSAVTRPSKVAGLHVTERTETSVTLQWNIVENSKGYNLSVDDQPEVFIPPVSEGTSQTHVVPSLSAGTRYNLTVFTVGVDNLRSSGTKLSASTSPSNVDDLNVTERNETSVTLQWNIVKNSKGYNLSVDDQPEVFIPPASEGTSQTHVVPSLSAGTRYNLTFFTVGVDDLRSSGTKLSASTSPSKVDDLNVTERNETSVTLQWNIVKNSKGYNLSVDDQPEVFIPPVSEGTSQTHVVPSLSAGTRYNLTVFTVGVDNLRSSGTKLTASTSPSNVDDLNVTERTETSVTLQWNIVENSQGYNLSVDDQPEVFIPPASEGTSQTHVVLSLSAGTRYNLTFFTVGVDDLRSSGTKLTAITTPVNVAGGVQVTERSQNTVTLQWIPVNGISDYILLINNRQINISADEVSAHDRVELMHVVTGLTPGTEYNLTFFSVFEGVRSSGINDFTVTRMNCPASKWIVSNTSIKATLEGLFTKATATNSKGEHTSVGGGQVWFTGLSPGSNYTVALFYEREGRVDTQCEHNLTLVPPDLSNWRCDYSAGGYALSLSWEAQLGEWSAAEANLTGRAPQKEISPNVLSTQITGLQPAKTYSISLGVLSGDLRSNPVVISCGTDPRGVIGGSITAVLLLILLAGLAVFILRRKPELLKPVSLSHSKISANQMKAIPTRKFPEHYHQLCVDQNRGFSEEYEDFAPVGTEQSRRAALDPEVKDKNRFTNVLPYDWSRVKLSFINPDRTSEYINASYMPGYGGNKQYIAAQGPLPSTINDFWRMIWEQRVRAVVMVTNCVEGGRGKCEQYWPLDSAPCLYGGLLVTITSQHRDPDWTLREFRVKNESSAEERSVKHFHFTSWPDHGVPQGTTALIQFRQLVRQHIEGPGAGGGPTVVHCSAGVGRTGTLIALDVTLQQMERERAVGIAAFVHKMRQSRPLMVQTESQYVYLHQCIMDSLEPKTAPSENLYENSDMIYANATALREFQKANSSV
ncbi:receptor-type tyrosine-protein phosphatase H-like [Hypomesus transpacificus]|uniref:receptor-type tyrosine-protein phosphatase H-like n=1 Tax=Hypomesus transpacificus TaxID=137520 RepID=UPI001F07E31E|nr:receptor-type tyrosine-protein phosphatase H-like [Hypomesus transpacificus]